MSNRLHSSAALLQNPLTPTEDGFGKIFLLAAVHTDRSGRVVISINDTTPTVALNDETRDAFGLKHTVREIQNGHKTYSLVSAGTFIWLCPPDNQSPRAILLEKNDLNQLGWTEPAKRCDRDPQETFNAAANEELLILFRETEKEGFAPIIIGSLNNTKHLLKEKQIDARAQEMRIAAAPVININANTTWRMDPEEMRHEAGLYQDVVVSLNGIQQQPFSAICIFNPNFNTLELRRSAAINVAEGNEVVFYDGENFGRQTAVFTLSEIAELKLRPALDLYRRAVKEGKPSPIG